MISLIDLGSIIYDLDTPYDSPLGGSETTLVLLNKGFAELGYDVILYNRKNNLNILDVLNKSDDIIIHRFLPNVNPEIFKDKNVYYYAQDAIDQSTVHWMQHHQNIDYFNNIFCISNWQRNTFINGFNIPVELQYKFVVVGNPIDYSLSTLDKNRDKYKMIYAGIPQKGLRILPDIYKDVKRNMGDKITFDIYSSFKLYQDNDSDKEYSKWFDMLKEMNGVNIFDPVSMTTFNEILSKSSVYISPNLYPETFGNNLIISQSNGCIPICTSLGSMNDTIYFKDTIVPTITDIYVPTFAPTEHYITYKLYVDKICEVFDNIDNFDRNEMSLWSKKFDYLNITKKYCEVMFKCYFII